MQRKSRAGEAQDALSVFSQEWRRSVSEAFGSVWSVGGKEKTISWKNRGGRNRRMKIHPILLREKRRKVDSPTATLCCSRILEFSEFSDGEAKFREFFETSPRNVGWVILEKEKTIRKDSRGEERERQGRLLNEINERSNDRQEVLIHFSRRRTAPARSRSFNSLINTESADILSFSLSLSFSHPPTSSKRRNEES